jgi:hypothetical protein
MGFDEPGEHEFARDVKCTLGRRINLGCDVPDATLLDGHVLLPTSDNATA